MVGLYNVILAILAMLYLFSKGASKKYYKIFFGLMILILVFFASVRFQFDGDFRNNLSNFQRLSSLPWASVISVWNGDVGWHILQKLIFYIDKTGQLQFAVASLLTIIPYGFICKKYSKDPTLSVFLFYCFGFYFSANNITRQYIAVGICLIALFFAIERKTVPFLLLTLLAATFHVTALAFIPVYFLLKIRFNRKSILIFVATYAVVLIGFKSIYGYFQQLTNNALDYNDGYGTTAASTLGIIIPAIILSISCFYYYIKSKRNSAIYATKYFGLEAEDSFPLYMFFISFMFTLCQVSNMLILGRMAAYYNVSYLLIIPEFINLFSKKSRVFIIILIILFASVYVLLFNSLGKLTPTPYYFFWNI